MPIGPPSTGMAYTASPLDASFHDPSVYLSLTSLAPNSVRSTRALRMLKLESTSDSSWMTSGAPDFDSIEVENLVYSSLPWPALVQQTCTSSWLLLNRSTTSSNAGYQAHTLTWGASALTILLVQDASVLLDVSAEAEHPVSAAAATAMTPTEARNLVFIEIFPLAG